MGQINLDTQFGNVIKEIASNPLYHTFCEVGTWNGKGSTRCIYEGIQDRPNTHLYSIEGDPFMFHEAEKLWSENPKVSLLMGTLHRTIMDEHEIVSHPSYYKVHDHYRLYYVSELRSVRLTPLVTVPPCDCILLDGGEFSTYGDWNALYHENLKVVMLDDTQVIKTNKLYNELKQNPSWKCMYDVPNDRNGWAVFYRI